MPHLRHLCIKGNAEDSKYAEDEIDRRGGDFKIPEGRAVSTEGIESLAAEGMPL